MPVGVSAYVALANITLGSSASSVTFSSIPATYRDLVLVMDIQGLSGGASSRNAYLTLNSNTGSSVFMYGGPSTQVSGTDGGDAQLPFGSGRNICIVNIMDYSATDKHKTILQRTGQDYNVVWANASRVAITSAVTSVSCVGSDSGSDQFIAGCTFALYGIAA